MEERLDINTPDHHLEIKAIMQNERWNNSNAKAYDRYRLISSRHRWMKLLTNELSQVPAGETVLDVGAGTGFITEILACSGYNVVATDLSSSMLELAARNVKVSGVSDLVRFIESDAESLEVEGNTYAAVVSRWLLWTLPCPRKALSEMVRTLAPGGCLVLIDGQHQKMKRLASWRSSLVDFLLTGRFPGWQPEAYSTITHALPRLDAPEVATVLRELGLKHVRSRRLSDKEGDGLLKNWLMGNSWKSYLVTGAKPE